jgi:GrpB-like predicted nucleotidyltransferase (UPF0157 family)
VQLFRFDEEVSIPVHDFGSSFRVGRLIGPGSDVAVQVVHLPANGLIGRHTTNAQQLLAVVAGQGWVIGGDGDCRGIRAGWAALWETGEDHAAGTDGGLTAISIEGTFEVRALSVTVDIVVSDYDPQWPEWFETVRRRVWPAVSDIAFRIDHVGSTSVPGLAAKPIIDMDIVVASLDRVRPVIDRLARIGYEWRGDLGVPGREAFQPVRDQGMPPHHLYLVVENNKAHLDHWLLRDLLRQDAGARDQYAGLKRRNVELANSDMDVYVAAKAEFVAGLLTRARAERGLPAETYWEPDVDGE